MFRFDFFFLPARCAYHLSTLLALVFFMSCDAKRDSINDPVTTPHIVPLDITFDESLGASVIHWRYLGIEPVAKYRLIRYGRDGRLPFDWHEVSELNREVTTESDIWEMTPIVDQATYAGEVYNYEIFVENTLGRKASTNVGQTTISGSRLESLLFHPEEGMVRVVWSKPTGNVREQVLLRQDNANTFQGIYTIQNATDTSYVDVVREGNNTYHYILKSTLNTDIEVTSRIYIFQPFLRSQTYSVDNPQNVPLRIQSANLLGRSLMALYTNTDGFVLRGIQLNGAVSGGYPLSGIPSNTVTSSALSFSEARIGNLAGILVAYVNRESKVVELKAYTLSFFEDDPPIEQAWNYQNWTAPNADLPITLCVTSQGYIAVGRDQQIRFFTANREEIGTIDLGLQGPIQNFLIDQNLIWVSVVGDQNLYMSPSIIDASGNLSPPNWQVVALQAVPLALLERENGVYVLTDDKVVQVINMEGISTLSWRGFDDLAWGDGIAGITSTTDNDVFVWNSLGNIVQFQNNLPVLKKEEK